MIIKAVIDEKITKIMKKTTNVVAAVTVAAHITKVPADFQAEKVHCIVPGHVSVIG